jgi:hypothetical protein
MMGKNKLYRRKTPCTICKGSVIHNQTHHLTYCPCTAPIKQEIQQKELAEQWETVGGNPAVILADKETKREKE